MRTSRAVTAMVAVTVTALTVAACGAGRPNSGSTASGSSSASSSGGGSSSNSLIVGTTDKVVSIDPAGSYDNGSTAVQTQVYQYLLNFPVGAKKPQPDAAKSCSFTKPTVYTCILKSGLKFANGDPLTAKSVAWSFQRIVKINDPNGPASLLANMKSVAAQNTTTVAFTLNSPNDQTWPQVLVTSAGPIVDEKVYPANKVLSDDAVVASKATSGPYMITSYQKNQLAQFQAYSGYNGAYGTPKTSSVTMKYYTESNNMKLDVQNGNIDVAYRSLTPDDYDSLAKAKNVKVYKGSGGELRYIVFNLKTMPGNTVAQKLAVRQAIASSVDRNQLSQDVYKGTYTPAYSAVPAGQIGATTPFETLYGSSPSASKAAAYLSKAGVKTPVTLNLEYNTDHYGSSSTEEYNDVKRQLEATKLFKVNLQSAEYTSYSKERVKDSYPLYQLGWFPDFPDADNYVSPFFGKDNFLQSHYADATMVKLLDQERTQPNQTKRNALLAQIQMRAAQQLPILPLLTGAQVVAAQSDVQGVQSTLDPAFKFRFTVLSK